MPCTLLAHHTIHSSKYLIHLNLKPSTLQGFEVAKKALLTFLDDFKEPVDGTDREVLRCVARTSLRTKLHETLADQLTDIVTDAVLTIRKADTPIDLHMVSCSSKVQARHVSHRDPCTGPASAERSLAMQPCTALVSPELLTSTCTVRQT